MRLEMTDGTKLLYRAIESLAAVERPGGWFIEIRTVSGATYLSAPVPSRERADQGIDLILDAIAQSE